jgi:hypothetical protein
VPARGSLAHPRLPCLWGGTLSSRATAAPKGGRTGLRRRRAVASPNAKKRCSPGPYVPWRVGSHTGTFVVGELLKQASWLDGGLPAWGTGEPVTGRGRSRLGVPRRSHPRLRGHGLRTSTRPSLQAVTQTPCRHRVPLACIALSLGSRSYYLEDRLVLLPVNPPLVRLTMIRHQNTGLSQTGTRVQFFAQGVLGVFVGVCPLWCNCALQTQVWGVRRGLRQGCEGPAVSLHRGSNPAASDTEPTRQITKSARTSLRAD